MPSRDDFDRDDEDQPRRKPRASREDEFVTANRPVSSAPRRPRREESEPEPSRSPKKKNNTLLMVLLLLGGVGLMSVCTCCGVGGYFGYGLVQDASETKKVSNDLKQIGLAFHNHHDTHMYFPPNFTSKDGKKAILSWRVALLPYLEQDSLFKQFKLDEPWDGPNNRKLIDRCPKIYLSRRHKDPSLTCYCGFAGPRTIFDPLFPKVRIANIPDGLSNTIFVAEAENPVVWSEPEDLPFDPKGPLPPLHYRANNAAVLMGDASVRLIQPTLPDQTMRFLIMRDDGNVIPDW